MILTQQKLAIKEIFLKSHNKPFRVSCILKKVKYYTYILITSRMCALLGKL